jgi:hypothetical protein
LIIKKKNSFLQICMSFYMGTQNATERDAVVKVLSPLISPSLIIFAWVERMRQKNATLKYIKFTIIIVHSHLMLKVSVK